MTSLQFLCRTGGWSHHSRKNNTNEIYLAMYRESLEKVMNQELDDILEELKKNPIFKMSLGSKELFHG